MTERSKTVKEQKKGQSAFSLFLLLLFMCRQSKKTVAHSFERLSLVSMSTIITPDCFPYFFCFSAPCMHLAVSSLDLSGQVGFCLDTDFFEKRVRYTALL